MFISSHFVTRKLGLCLREDMYFNTNVSGFTLSRFLKKKVFVLFCSVSKARRVKVVKVIIAAKLDTEEVKRDFISDERRESSSSSYLSSKTYLLQLKTNWIEPFQSETCAGRTVDGDLGRPLGGAVQDALLDALHVLRVDHLGDVEQLPDLLEDLWLVPLANLHPVLHSHDDVLRPVLRPRLGALLGRP